MSTNPLSQSLPKPTERVPGPFDALVNKPSGTQNPLAPAANPLAQTLPPQTSVQSNPLAAPAAPVEEAAPTPAATEQTPEPEQAPVEAEQAPTEPESVADEADEVDEAAQEKPAPKKATKAASKTPSKTAAKSTRTTKAKTAAKKADDGALGEITASVVEALRPVLRDRLSAASPVEGIRIASEFQEEISAALAAMVGEVTEPTVSAYKGLLLALAGGQDGEYDGYSVIDGEVQTQ